MIFSLFANSSARSNGILHIVSLRGEWDQDCLPDALQVHGTNLYDVARLLALENAIPSSSGHASHVEKLRAVDKVIV